MCTIWKPPCAPKRSFHKDKEYVVRGEVLLSMSLPAACSRGRRWSEGLHQAIEAKEGVNVQKESRTFASITYQNYFRLYDKLAGMTGTAKTSAEEFYKVYGLEVVEIPTNRDRLCAKTKTILFSKPKRASLPRLPARSKSCTKKGSRYLIGTVSIEKNELLERLP
jgi:preprotein translocase subunit SecA